MDKSATKKALQFLWQKIKPYWKVALLMSFFEILSISCDLLRPYFYKSIIDYLSASDSAGAMLALVYLSLTSVGHHLFFNIGHYFLVWFAAHVMRDVAIKSFRHVEKLSYAFHTANLAGATVKKCTRGVDAVEGLIDRVWFDFTPLLIELCAVSIILFSKGSALTILLIAGVILFLTVTIYLNNKQALLEEESIKADTRNSGYFHDVVGNIVTVKVFAKQEAEAQRFWHFLTDWKTKTMKAWWYYNRIMLAQGGISLATEIGLMYFSIRFYAQGTFTIGDIVFVQTYFMLIMNQVWRLGWVYRDFRRAVVNAGEMIELLEIEPVITNSTAAHKIEKASGEIELKNVRFNYTDGTDAVFHDLSLKIKAGERVALVGPSGSGKSTLVKLLLRLMDPSSGQVLLDGHDIKKITVESLRSSIGLVPQDPLLFHRTLKENIAYGKPDATDEEIKNASELAHAHEFIKDLPQVYETYVGERGVKLSGGERQRVAIARVILQNAPIVILDEATSSLDSISEKHIQAALNNLMKNRTTIVVAHRLSTIINMDRILVFQKGHIVEEGKHEELIQREGSLYKKLWDIQVGGFLPE